MNEGSGNLFYEDSLIRIYLGNCLDVLKTLPDESVHCCVTSPPYWGLRDYGVDGQIGLEATPEEFVAKMVEVFREVRRVLRKDGTAWVNMGDSYNAYNGNAGPGSGFFRGAACDTERPHFETGHGLRTSGLKPKDLCGIPWRLAFALQDDGWWLRQDIIWHKPNPMPESVTDRCTKAHEYIFLLSKSERYFYDAEAVKEPAGGWNGSKFDGERDRLLHPNVGRGPRNEHNGKWSTQEVQSSGYRIIQNVKRARDEGADHDSPFGDTRNKRSVWTVPSASYSEAHFATFPPDLIKPCILAGTSAKGCCPKCGAPWERMVKRSGGTIGHDWNQNIRGRNGDGDDLKKYQKLDPANTNGTYRVETLGWQPTCDCGCAETIPCTVLDPFGGSGTTGQVANEFGRKAIIIELNPEYVKLAKDRTNVTPGLNLA